MKFGESLSETLVPEWKDQYVDYKAGKKQIKKVAALHDELNGRKTSDTTPLLDPLEGETNYVQGENSELGPAAYESPEPELAKRRPSIFNLSLKLSKNKKEEFYEERAKFTKWLDDELRKVEGFYVEKEKDIYERFLVLEDQFYQLKEHRVDLVKKHKDAVHAKQHPVTADVNGWLAVLAEFFRPVSRYEFPSLPSSAWLSKLKKGKPKLKDIYLKTQKTTEEAEFDPNFRENQIRNGELVYDTDDVLIASSEASQYRERYLGAVLQQQPEQNPAQAARARRRDYVPKKSFGVPYLYAKRQLKNALIEHYRLISLLRSYRVLNRTALRKITKKFDKAIQTSICKDFMEKIDNEAYFQNSEVLEKIASRIEDLYLTFFDSEKGERKHGLEKLRSAAFAYNNADIRKPTYYKAIFGAGLFLGIGFPLFAIALYNALEKTLDGLLPEGNFLMQIWAGFFLINLMFLLVGINFIVFHKFKINYKFIFELNLATALDYKQFLLLPSITFGFLGILGWFSFQDFWPNKFPGRNFPLIYLGVCLVIFLWPGSLLYPASRKWLQIALWRLFCSGFYPVEFRDFSSGDIFCSLTYSAGNLSFFFCLYTRDWRNIFTGGVASSHSRCGSNHSELMGFLATLPSIWRFLQCGRRFMDSGDAFPHLANMLKYLVGVLYYCLLSLWRIHRTQLCRVLFITVASVNSIYCSIWDIVMDWSLLQSNSEHFLLRDHLFYGRPIYYYLAMVMNVLLRFQWIFYAFFSHQIQQLAVTSFAIAVAEITRRFIWLFFRMENEHCTNVILFRASRDSPVPYIISAQVEAAIKKLVVARYEAHKALDAEFSAEALQPTEEPSTGRTTAYSGSATLKVDDEESNLGRRKRGDRSKLARRKSTFLTITDALNRAHIKDFQRKRYAMPIGESDEDDEDEDDERLQQLSRRNSIG